MPLSVLCLKCSPTVNVKEGASDDAVDVASVLAHVLNKHSVLADFFQYQLADFWSRTIFLLLIIIVDEKLVWCEHYWQGHNAGGILARAAQSNM